MGALYSVRVEERMRAPAHGQGPSCPPSKGPLQFPIIRTSFPGSPGQRGFRRLHQGEVQRKPWPGERFPCAWPSFSASQPEFGGFALRCWEVKPELELLGVEVWVASCPGLRVSQGSWSQLAGGVGDPQYPHPLGFWSSPFLGDCGWREGARQLESLQPFSKAARGGWGIRLD